MTGLNRFASGTMPNAQIPRAAASPPLDGPRRADRAAKSTSTGGARLSGGTGTSKVDEPGTPSRFAHFANVSLSGATLPEPVADAPALRGAMKVSAMRAEVAAIGRQQVHADTAPTFASADAAARSALRAHGRATVPKASATPVAGTAEALGDQALATARRLGIIP